MESASEKKTLSTLSVREDSIVEDLEEERHELPSGLLDLVDKNESVGL